jgi:predicted nucleotidyltransferase
MDEDSAKGVKNSNSSIELPMSNLTILYKTDVAAVNEALSTLIRCLEEAFTGRIRAYYLHGSYADGSAVDTSDVDVTVLFKERLHSDAEHQSVQILIKEFPSKVQLDVSIEDEVTLLTQADPAFKLAGQLLYGEDIRDQLPLMPIAAWTRDRMHTSYWRMVKLFHRLPPVQQPLFYPDPTDEFYGYVRHAVQLESGEEIVSTRDLMRAVGWMATALIALHTGRYVTRKADLYTIYQQAFDDQWGSFVEEIYRRCKVEWKYRIPAERAALRDLCSRVLGFERHFLTIYRNFLLQELTSGDEPSLRHILWLLEQIPWQDTEIIQAADTVRHKLLSL